MHIQDRDFSGGAAGPEAVARLAQIATEREKTRRILIVSAVGLFCVAALVVVFAPPGKEGLAYVLGAALLVIALGAIGASQFKFSVPGVTLEANAEKRDLQSAIKAAEANGQIIQHQGMADPRRGE